ncbi:MAG: hypothetical protein RLZZ200_886, partial [Pseudomonadota bacterium]
LVQVTGTRLWGGRAGDAAALVLLATPLYMLVGQLNLLDMGVTFFLTAALCAFLLAQCNGAGEAENRRWMIGVWISVSLGFLQKGLVAGAVPVLALVTYSAIQRDWGVWRRLHLGMGVAIFVVLCAPWVIALGWRNIEYASFFIIHEHFTRFLTTEHQRVEPWWFFVAVFGAGALPWSLAMLAAGWRSIAERGRGRFDVSAALAVWALVVVVFFSLSGSKLAPYIMPAVPPLALLLGREMDRGLSARGQAVLLGLAAALVLLLLASKPLVLLLVPAGLKKTFYGEVSNWVTAGGVCASLGVLGATWLWRKGRGIQGCMSISMGLYLCWMVVMGGANLMADLRGVPGAQAKMAPRIAAGEPFYCVGTYLHSLSFELGRTCRLVEYRGELQFQFETDRGSEPLGMDAFAREWSERRGGVALVFKQVMPKLEALGVQTRILAEYPEFLIVEHP